MYNSQFFVQNQILFHNLKTYKAGYNGVSYFFHVYLLLVQILDLHQYVSFFTILSVSYLFNLRNLKGTINSFWLGHANLLKNSVKAKIFETLQKKNMYTCFALTRLLKEPLQLITFCLDDRCFLKTIENLRRNICPVAFTINI